MKRSGQTSLTLLPITFPKANAWVEHWHRHHKKLPGGFAWFCVAAVSGTETVGVAIAGRPTNRNNDDRQTVEILRLATNGHPNACSVLLGACARAAKAIGARRCLTYTLVSEQGSSLRGAGWVREVKDTGKSWWTHTGSRTPAIDRHHMAEGKSRWVVTFRDLIACSVDSPPPTGTATITATSDQLLLV